MSPIMGTLAADCISEGGPRSLSDANVVAADRRTLGR
jgi:hypothetical protein